MNDVKISKQALKMALACMIYMIVINGNTDQKNKYHEKALKGLEEFVTKDPEGKKLEEAILEIEKNIEKEENK